MYKLFAGSWKMNQQKVCTSTFAWESKLVVIEAAKSLSVRHFTHVQTFCWYDENEPAKSLHFANLHVCKLFAGSSKINQQKVCTSTFYTCANFLLVRRKWTSKKFVISTFAWESKLVVVEPDIWLFALVCLTVQWSCRSMLMLWWSDSSATTTVLMQWYSSVNM